ncbi:ATP-binding protein [Streptomyces mirabilis]|uniref:ATP-binding protein n=1 Tax=Streptomyces mirabilis TaxID=68239 RepID=A0ABU3V2S0_9ACTN|nr:ATP-binding protein [Streptomyces mirabilis]MCX4615202.1 ATP-binding protein [Streptomyces mirabilis]MCX5356530.1 ATP-binding protein [Streptomyces mirabilis]MDU9000480.1 ATP-binding protein [Streptomyces mirabilis]
MGKTTVLDTVTTGAGHNGVRVLRAAGMRFEADINYAGLKPLLVPLALQRLRHPGRRPPRRPAGRGRHPLQTCSRRSPDLHRGPPAAPADLRPRTPLLLVIDDLPWLDRATNAVLGFVARRLVRSRISFLAASREGSDSFYESSDLSEPRLKPLDDASSAELLALAHPDVSPRYGATSRPRHAATRRRWWSCRWRAPPSSPRS